jgi:hypothetical protein
LPEDALIPTSTNLDNAAALADSWAAGETALEEIPVDDWSPQATIHFINSLPDDLAHDRLARLDAAWNLSQTRNAEIGRTWFIQVATRRYTDAYDALEAHLNRYGRGRLIAPVYVALAENGQDRELSLDLFKRAQGAYHPIAVSWIGAALEAADASR